MFEMLMKPKRAERKPWEMFFIGMLYASLSFLLVTLFFSKGAILRDGAGLLIVTFTVISCIPFMYYIIKLEEDKDIEIDDSGKLIKEHSKAIHALMWMFLGFVVAFSLWYLIMPEQDCNNFNFQLRTFCAINNPTSYDTCLETHGVPPGTGQAAGVDAVLGIFANNVYVLIFTIIRKDLQGEQTWRVLQDALILIIIAIIILVVAALIEVYFTHRVF